MCDPAGLAGQLCCFKQQRAYAHMRVRSAHGRQDHADDLRACLTALNSQVDPERSGPVGTGFSAGSEEGQPAFQHAQTKGNNLLQPSSKRNL